MKRVSFFPIALDEKPLQSGLKADFGIGAFTLAS
jgi:hypothetical protein